MTMPIIPALAGEPMDVPPLSELLANLSDDDVTQLEQEAADWMAGAPAEGEELPPEEVNETPEDEAAETPEEQEAEQAAGTEGQSPRDMLEAARSASYEIDDQVSELEQLISQAEAHEKAGADVDGMTEQLDIAQAAQEEAVDCLEAAQDAVDSEDVGAAAKAATDARKLAAKVTAALAAAKQIVQRTAKEALDTAVPDEVLAFDAWAKKQAGQIK